MYGWVLSDDMYMARCYHVPSNMTRGVISCQVYMATDHSPSAIITQLTCQMSGEAPSYAWSHPTATSCHPWNEVDLPRCTQAPSHQLDTKSPIISHILDTKYIRHKIYLTQCISQKIYLTKKYIVKKYI